MVQMIATFHTRLARSKLLKRSIAQEVALGGPKCANIKIDNKKHRKTRSMLLRTVRLVLVCARKHKRLVFVMFLQPFRSNFEAFLE